MALTINTNLSSLMVQLSLKKSTLDLNRALEQMTTGYRINSAKDDAAGYAVATKMNIDLSSYRVAQNNANLGLSLLNTAESSLDIVTTHLQRIRDLAEQAANGTYGQDSIDAIQMEIDQRTEEINRIMETTEYNGIQLFKGDAQPGVATGSFIQEVTPLTEGEALAQGYTVIKTAADLDNIRNNLSGKYILMNDIDLAGVDWTPINSFSGELNGNGYVVRNLNCHTNGAAGLFVSIAGIISNLGLENVNVTADNSGGIAGGIAATTKSGANPIIKNCYVTGSVSTSNDFGYVGGLIGSMGYDSRYNPSIISCYTDAIVSGWSAGGITGGTGSTSGSGGGPKIDNCYSLSQVHGIEYSGGLVGFHAHSITTNSYVAGPVSNANWAGALFGGGWVGSDSSIGNNYFDIVATKQNSAIYSGTVSGTQGIQTTELERLIANGTLPQAKFNTNIDNNQNGSIVLQVGIDSSENSRISFDTALSINLNVNVSTTANARNSLDAIDAMLDTITQKQTEFGAVQNRLESVIDSLDVSIENTTSSLSTIKDADIAKVSSDFIRAQILQQASASLLATANQSPSIVLGLI